MFFKTLVLCSQYSLRQPSPPPPPPPLTPATPARAGTRASGLVCVYSLDRTSPTPPPQKKTLATGLKTRSEGWLSKNLSLE